MAFFCAETEQPGACEDALASESNGMHEQNASAFVFEMCECGGIYDPNVGVHHDKTPEAPGNYPELQFSNQSACLVQMAEM